MNINPTCPLCGARGGALTAKPHCASPTCTWNICECGTTYDRSKGDGFREKPPMFIEANGKVWEK